MSERSRSRRSGRIPGWLALPTALLGIALAAWACGGGPEDGAAAEEHEHGGIAITLWTDSVELFYEHPPLVAGGPGEPWAVHVTDLEDFRPVTEGSLTLRLRGPDGQSQEATADAPARPGIFTPAPALPAPGRWRVEMEIRSPQVGARVEVPAVEVFEAAPPAPEEGEAGAGISFLKEQQWVIPFATHPATEREIPRTIGASGELIATPGRLVRIVAPVSGHALAELNRNAPVPGRFVRRGERLAVLAPASGESSFSSLVAEVERLERESERVERLYEEEAVPRKRLEETQHELAVARAALESVGGSNGSGAGSGYHYSVTTPIDGVVNVRSLELGARVEAGQHLFTVVDSRTVWLRARVRAGDAAALTDVRGASFVVEGGSDARRTDRVISVGDLIDPETRTINVLLEVENDGRELKVGMLADVRLFVGESQMGVAIPAAAILEEDGLPVTYVQTGGESFERRVLELGPSDDQWTLVRAGVTAGERVVTEGAYQVKLASLATGEVADHGHAH